MSWEITYLNNSSSVMKGERKELNVAEECQD